MQNFFINHMIHFPFKLTDVSRIIYQFILLLLEL